MGLGCPDCVTLYIAFTLFGSSWSDFCFSIPEGKTTLDVFYRLTGTALHGSHRAVTWQWCEFLIYICRHVQVYFPFWQVVSEWTLLGCGLRRRLHQFPLPISWYADFCFSLQVGGPLSFGRYFLSHLRTQVRCTVVLWSREYWSTIPPHLLERGTKSESPKMPLLLGEGHTHVIPLSSSHLLNFYVMYTSTLWLQVGGMKASETHPFGRWFAWWWPQTFLKVLRPTTNPVVISCIWQKEPNHFCFYTCSCPKPHSFLFVTNFIFF